jgi:bis(5'-nucleosyl)-tetraphosphatase (symmetrical)
MAIYAIGDIQGCYYSFKDLLKQVDFDPAHDRLWLVGDLLNRGSGSLEVLRWLYEHRMSVVIVLGNHDLHAIAVAEGMVPAHNSDTLEPIFNAPDCDELLHWLRHQSMIHAEHGYLMVHAGLLPQWSATKALSLGAEVETALRAGNYRDFLAHMYGNLPDQWDENLQGMDRLRLITNALTRLRTCTSEGRMDFAFSGAMSNIPAGYMPWFDVPDRKSVETPIIFGHWSALGLLQRDNLFALDTGCLWGGKLTALRLHDRSIFQVPCSNRDLSLLIQPLQDKLLQAGLKT